MSSRRLRVAAARTVASCLRAEDQPREFSRREGLQPDRRCIWGDRVKTIRSNFGRNEVDSDLGGGFRLSERARQTCAIREIKKLSDDRRDTLAVCNGQRIHSSVRLDHAGAKVAQHSAVDFPRIGVGVTQEDQRRGCNHGRVLPGTRRVSHECNTHPSANPPIVLRSNGLGVSPAARGPGFARSRATNNVAQLRRANPATPCAYVLHRARGEFPCASPPGCPGPPGANPSRAAAGLRESVRNPAPCRLNPGVGSGRRVGLRALNLTGCARRYGFRLTPSGCRARWEAAVASAGPGGYARLGSLSPALASSLRRGGRLRRAFVGGSAPHTPTFSSAGVSTGGAGATGPGRVSCPGFAVSYSTLQMQRNDAVAHSSYGSAAGLIPAGITGPSCKNRTNKTIAQPAITCYIIDVGCARHRSRFGGDDGAKD